MAYIDGFVIPVATSRREEYRAHEARWWPEFKAMGALTLVVGWGDDIPPGKQTDFLRSVGLKEDETVVLAWMTWPDKETRNRAYAAMEERSKTDPDMAMSEMPFDGARMIYGGFTPLLMED